MSAILTIRNLHAGIEDHSILTGVDLTIEPNRIHAIMGPNGSGKSTLAHVIMGHPSYRVTNGDLLFQGQSILKMQPDERARLGIFLAFQHPAPLPGIPLVNLLRKPGTAVRGDSTFSSMGEFFAELNDLNAVAGLPREMLSRDTNDGFSGGEKKTAEILQMAMMRPRLAILDEIDSGLDIDALNRVSDVVNRLREGGRSFLIITHYSRILSRIQPDVVHVMKAGKIVRSGGDELIAELESDGYGEMEAAS